jgi:hypothetical protein
MPLITVKAGTGMPPGTYPATLISISPKRMVTQYSKNGEEQDFLEWAWDVDGTEIRSLTTTATGPKSRIFEYLVALLGADKVVVDAGFEENDLVGKRALLSLVLNDDGFSKVDRVVAAPKQAPRAAQPAPRPSAVQPTPAAPAPAVGQRVTQQVIAPDDDDAPLPAYAGDDDLPF